MVTLVTVHTPTTDMVLRTFQNNQSHLQVKSCQANNKSLKIIMKSSYTKKHVFQSLRSSYRASVGFAFFSQLVFKTRKVKRENLYCNNSKMMTGTAKFQITQTIAVAIAAVCVTTNNMKDLNETRSFEFVSVRFKAN